MKTKTLLQAIGMVFVVMMATGIFIYWTTPMLRFAADGVKDQIPTQIFVFIVRAMAWGAVCGVFSMGILYAYQFKPPRFLAVMLIGLYFLLTGVGMKIGLRYAGAAALSCFLLPFYCLLPLVFFFRRHFQPSREWRKAGLPPSRRRDTRAPEA